MADRENNNYIKRLKKVYRSFDKKGKTWATDNIAHLAIYNIIIIVLVLLNSAGYFHPFFPITINIISLAAISGAVVLLGARTGVMFALSLGFLVLAGFMLLVDVRVWADRTMIYMFQSFVLGILLLFWEDSGTIK